MILIIPLQLYVWIGTNLSKQTDELLKDLSTNVVRVSEHFSHVDQHWTEEDAKKFFVDAESLKSTAKRIIHNAYLLDLFALSNKSYDIPKGANLGIQQVNYDYTMALVRLAQDQAFLAEENINLIVGVTTFFLPILFGALGAVAYVIRQFRTR
jgi:hypothetical protein